LALSFLKNRKVAQPPKYAGSKKGDPLTAAKAKVVEGIKTQKGYVQLTVDAKPLPKSEGGREASTWYYREIDGTYWTTLRYGQLSIPLDGPNTAVQVGKLEDLTAFYDSVVEAIGKGELDGPIGKLQADRSAALKGKTGTKRAA
jgi:hypothetical protein